jgi:hypothetical protein
LRELGRVVRTWFLQQYLANLELRHEIQTATTKSERFNKFVRWVSFGGDRVIAENVRDEQRKFIQYNHLVANLLIFHNLVSMTRATRNREADGCPVSDELAAAFSPYSNEHINQVRKLQAELLANAGCRRAGVPEATAGRDRTDFGDDASGRLKPLPKPCCGPACCS